PGRCRVRLEGGRRNGVVEVLVERNEKEIDIFRPALRLPVAELDIESARVEAGVGARRGVAESPIERALAPGRETVGTERRGIDAHAPGAAAPVQADARFPRVVRARAARCA